MADSLLMLMQFILIKYVMGIIKKKQKKPHTQS